MSESQKSSFNIEDIIKTPNHPGIRAEPKPEELIEKLRDLLQDKKVHEDELKETMTMSKAKKEEEEAITSEVLWLEEKLNEKEDINRSLQLKCVEIQREKPRRLEQNFQKEEAVTQNGFQIQETKLKHRKIRMKFENQLQQLMEQHKNLFSVFAPPRLPEEIQSAECITDQLLKANKQKLEQLCAVIKTGSQDTAP